ncbi:MAG: hypothetical protein ACREBR_03280 [bacterium]
MKSRSVRDKVSMSKLRPKVLRTNVLSLLIEYANELACKLNPDIVSVTPKCLEEWSGNMDGTI